MANSLPINQSGMPGAADDYNMSEPENPKGLGIGGFLKNFGNGKLTREGQPAKKRGPKPDSKPAMTRRQELNRQAQRTHRERKEQYIKALEQEVMRLKENFSAVSRTKDSLAEENRQLKQLLLQHGISWTGTGGVDEFTRSNQVPMDYTSSGSISGSYANSSSAQTPPSMAHSGSTNLNSPPRPFPLPEGRAQVPFAPQPGIDYDQAGIDFVLTLERPCMDHLQLLVEMSIDPNGIPCGHTMMASCPPEPLPEGHGILFNESNVHADQSFGQKTWDINKPDLANLMDLSKRLNLEGEITPVMAWGIILAHPRFAEFQAEDFTKIAEELVTKVRCYGFGAVLEEFEVRDSIESVLYYKQDPFMLQ